MHAAHGRAHGYVEKAKPGGRAKIFCQGHWHLVLYPPHQAYGSFVGSLNKYVLSSCMGRVTGSEVNYYNIAIIIWSTRLEEQRRIQLNGIGIPLADAGKRPPARS